MDQLILLSLLVLGLPLVSFLLVIFNQKALDDRAQLIAIPTIAFSLALSLYIAWMKLKGAPQGWIEWNFDWVHFGFVPGFGPMTLSNGVFIDNITAILLVVVTLVSLLVHIFSSGYMKNDARYARYFAFLGLFTFSMIGLVLASNFFGIFMFWELVGFSSYILIVHWYEKPGPQYAAKKAFIVNRIGDVAMWLGILLLFSAFHSFNIKELQGYINQGLPSSFSFLGFSPETTLTVAGVLLFCGAVAKSAQFPLHVWLPDAMEGPTPVSALIHAATMVAAGVYLSARIFPFLTRDAMLIVACTGAFTAFFAGIIAVAQNDIKRVLAYSTVSQLGLMIMSIGAGAVGAGIFHLITHAIFKACLFLGAGSVIHAMHRAHDAANDHTADAQDIRTMGGLMRRMPVTGWTYVIATLALTGIPLFSGFMSKDEILSSASAYGTLQGGIATAIPWVALFVSVLTAFYMWRQVVLVFFGEARMPSIARHVRETSKIMTAPLVILAGLCFWFWCGPNPIIPESTWFLKKWLKTPAQVIPPQTAPHYPLVVKPPVSDTTLGDSFGYSIAPIPATALPLPSEPMPHQIALERTAANSSLLVMLLSLGASLVGALGAWLIYLRYVGGRRMGAVQAVVYNGFYFDKVYEFLVSDTVIFAGRAAAWFDENLLDLAVNASAKITVFWARVIGWIDWFVVDGLVRVSAGFIQFFGLLARSFQSGRIQSYMTWAVAGMLVLFCVVQIVLHGLPW